MAGRHDTVVVKIGTSSITDDEGVIDRASVGRLCDGVAALRISGRRVVVVTSGAIAAGAVFYRTNLTSANLVLTDLTAAVLMEADMKSVNMTGASVQGLVDRRTFWCSTIYVDGTLKNDSCQIVTD